MKLSNVESIVKILMPKPPDGWKVGHEVRIAEYDDHYEVIAWRFQRDSYGNKLRETHRGACVVLDPHDIIELEYRSEHAVIAYVRDQLRYLFTLLFPPPLLNFRIGTKNHAKRLAKR